MATHDNLAPLMANVMDNAERHTQQYDHILFNGHGGSCDGEFNAEVARYGVVDPDLTVEHMVSSHKLLKVLAGSVSINDAPYYTGELFTFPIGTAFGLATGTEEPFRYVSRKVTDSLAPALSALKQQGVGTPEWLELSREEQFTRLRGLIGHTPLETTRFGDTTIYSKDEYKNPSGSHYDRAYLETIQYLESHGHIRPGDELRDISSGSAGISLAMLGTVLGYNVRIAVPDELPANRIYPILQAGAKVVSAGTGYIPAASEFQTKEILGLRKLGYKRIRIDDPEIKAIIFEKDRQRICYVNHSENNLSPKAFKLIGDEIINDMPQPLDALVLAIGNWTTIAGIVPVIRKAWPNTRIVGFEDSRNAPTYAAKLGHEIGSLAMHDSYGTSSHGVPLRFNDLSLLDQVLTITPEEREAMAGRINPGRQTFDKIGHTSVMGLVVAEKLARHNGLRNIGTIFYDQAVRY